jgi:glutaminase
LKASYAKTAARNLALAETLREQGTLFTEAHAQEAV